MASTSAVARERSAGAAGSGLVDPERVADRAAARAGIAVGLATAAYGISFGALAVAAGLDIWQTCVLSLLMFTGGSQFALVGALAAGGLAAGPSGIISAALLGARNSLYAVQVKPIIGGGFWRKVLAAHVTIDETTAVATAQPTLRTKRIGFWVTAAAVYIGWNALTLVGAIIGDALGDVRQYGLDAAAAAAFLGLLWPRLRARQPIVVAVGAVVVAASLTPWLPPGLPVLCAAGVALIVGLSDRPKSRDVADVPAGPAPAADAGLAPASESD